MSLRRQLDLFVCAVQFLTRLPTPPTPGFQPDWIARSTRYFPAVGQLVGLIAAALLMAAQAVWPAELAALLAIAVGVTITGGFHEDGLADTADGLGGGSTVARRLEIMKDSRIGSYGALALILILLLKTAALTALTERSAACAATSLIAAHGAGRAAAVVAMWRTPYVGDPERSKLKPIPHSVRAIEVLIALGFAAWPLVLLPVRSSVQGLALGGLCAFVVAILARRLIGGNTGDVLGAVEQVFEVGFLLGVSAVLKP